MPENVEYHTEPGQISFYRRKKLLTFIMIHLFFSCFNVEDKSKLYALCLMNQVGAKSSPPCSVE